MASTRAPRRAAGRRAICALATCALATLALTLLAGAAHAGSYAALDEAPAGGGELRLATPGTHVDPEGRPLIGFPLQATFVDVRIEGPMAQVTVEQTFENPFEGPIEAVYVFPMDDDAAVHAYSFRIGEREVVGRIEERDAARRQYEDARDAGQTAGLLEQAKPNVFVHSLANIAPGEAITVRFEYVVLLDYRHESGYGFHFPMTISPRYVSPDALTPNTVGGGGGAPGAITVPYVDEGLAEVEIVVRADAGVPLRGVESSSHAIDVEADDTRARVTLSEVTTAPDRDFVLNLRTAGDQTLLAALTHRDSELGGYFALMVQPKLQYADGDVTPREVVVLIDVSGSMSGAPIDRARQVAEGLLTSLRPADHFNVVTFASGTDRFSSRPVQADPQRVRDAVQFVRALTAGGGTELDDGLREALYGRPADERVRQVFLLTDGGIGYEEDVLALAQGAVGDDGGVNRVFPVGIGDAPNRYLLDRLAEQARGFASYLDLRGSASDTVDLLARRTAYPYLTDLTIDWGGLPVEDLTPTRLPDVYAGMPVVVSGRFDQPGEGEVVLRGRRGRRTFELPLQLTLPAAEDRPAVAYLWARQRIRALLAQQYGGETTAVRDEVTRLGLRFGLVTPYTSYVAVDESRTVEGTPQTVGQPNATPSGYGGGRVSGGYGGGSSGGGSYGDSVGGDLDAPTLALMLFAAVALLRRRRRGEV